MKKALTTGINGQDGYYLAKLFLKKGYEVHRIIRRSATFRIERIEHLYIDTLLQYLHKKQKITLHYGDIADRTNLIRIVQTIKPDEIYNLAVQSHMEVSFELPGYTAETDGIGTLRLLEAIRICSLAEKTRIYQASSSEIYGKVQEIPLSETTPFYPYSPYGITKNHRKSYNAYAVNGILFNHESEQRDETFVIRNITLSASRIAHGIQEKLYLGNCWENKTALEERIRKTYDWATQNNILKKKLLDN